VSDASAIVTGVTTVVDRLRLVNWNCCEGFDRKYPVLRELDFDVAVVIESGPFEAGLEQVRALSAISKLGVEGPGHTKCIAVLAQAPWAVEQLPLRADHPWLLPVRVRGPASFTLLAFWALGPEWVPGRPSYVAQAERVIHEILPEIDGPVVLAGDFNAPVAASVATHRANVAALAERGLVSAFEAARPGSDPMDAPTLYHQWKREKPFHVDHVFVPKPWVADICLTIGGYDDWVATKRSDHVPVVVDLEVVGDGGAA